MDKIETASRMLLEGATLVAEPCPYCGGVRVMKNGNAFCVDCGTKPLTREAGTQNSKPLDNAFEEKMFEMASELRREQNPTKQMEIIKSINALCDLAKKAKVADGNNKP